MGVQARLRREARDAVVAHWEKFAVGLEERFQNCQRENDSLRRELAVALERIKQLETKMAPPSP